MADGLLNSGGTAPANGMLNSSGKQANGDYYAGGMLMAGPIDYTQGKYGPNGGVAPDGMYYGSDGTTHFLNPNGQRAVAGGDYWHPTGAANTNMTIDNGATVGPTPDLKTKFYNQMFQDKQAGDGSGLTADYLKSTAGKLGTDVYGLGNLFGKDKAGTDAWLATLGGKSAPVDPTTKVQQLDTPLTTIQSNINTSNVPGLVGGADLLTAMRSGQDSAYNQAKSRLDPTWSNYQHDLENQLTQQGIPRGSEAWNRAIDEFSRNRNDAYSTAFNNSWNNGLASQGQLFTQGLQANQNAYGQASNNATFHNNAQGQNFSQGMQGQQFGLAQQAQDFNQGMQTKQFDQGLDLQNFNKDLATRQQNYTESRDALNRATGADNSTKSGLFGLGSTAIAAAMQNPAISAWLKQFLGVDPSKNGVNPDTHKSFEVIQNSNSPTGYVNGGGEPVLKDGTPVAVDTNGHVVLDEDGQPVSVYD